MKNKNKILSALVEAYKANKIIPVVSIEDCKRKVIVNDAISYAIAEIDNEEDEKKDGGEMDDRNSCKRGQAVSK